MQCGLARRKSGFESKSPTNAILEARQLLAHDSLLYRELARPAMLEKVPKLPSLIPPFGLRLCAR